MADEQVEETEAPQLRTELTVRVSVMERPLRIDEVGFACFDGGETEWPAVVLTDYAEVRTEGGVVGGAAGSYVVDGPNGIEVLSPVEFGQKFAFEAGVDPNEAPVDEGFVQDLDGAQQDEDPATAEKGTGEQGDTPGDLTGSPTNPQPEVEGSDETVDEVPPEDSEPADPDDGDDEGAEVQASQFESLDDDALWEVAKDLGVKANKKIGRAKLIARIDAAVAEAEKAPETTE